MKRPAPVPGSVPSSKAEVGTRVRAIAEKVGGVPELAVASGISESQLYRIIGGENELKVGDLVVLAALGEMTVEELATGKAPGLGGAPLSTGDGNAKRLAMEQLRALYAVPVVGEIGDDPAEHRTRGYVKGEYVYVPMFDVKAGAGRGKLPIGERIIAWPVFMLAFVRDKVGAQPENLCMITVDGDSMEPDLLNGSAVLVDLSDSSARREGTYVIRVGGAVLVKNLQRIPGGFIKVSTTNPSSRFEPFNLHERGMEEQDAAIIGRVVWADRVF